MQTTETTDNKIRLAPDVLAKAEAIAQTWGLKNSRAAVEAVFRKYADDYLYGREYRRPNPQVSQDGSGIPHIEPVRCECRSSGTGEAVAIWYEGDGSEI
jgi:hypothetical protein